MPSFPYGVPGRFRARGGTLEEDTALVMVTDGVVEGPGLTLDDGLERAGKLAAQADTEMGEGEEAAGGGEAEGAERVPRVPKQRCRVPGEVTAEVPQGGNTGSTPTGVNTVEQKPTTLPGQRAAEPRRVVPLKPAVAAVLARISAVAPRLMLGGKQRASLGPLVDEWLARGAEAEQVVAVATQGLPEDLLSPAGLVAYRLRNCMPPEPPPRVVSVAERPECEDCRRPLGSEVAPPDGLCGQCREELRRAVEWLKSPLPSAA